MDFPDHPFWDFSLEVYHREGVGAACLHLQARHGIDVNVMLFCLWLGHSGRGVMTDQDLRALRAATDQWHEVVVRGLRKIRTSLKTGFQETPEGLRETLRGSIQAAEINSEHLEQLLLAAAVDRPAGAGDAPLADRAADGGRNFGLYLDSLEIAFQPADCVHFAHVLGQAFPGIAPEAALDIAETLM
ncbi:MAG: TIGR02444 family protein [Alphaproteobacteria bacterium]|nr:TIGR02444 family protein [Alphaproteobacteria bacterium]